MEPIKMLEDCFYDWSLYYTRHKERQRGVISISMMLYFCLSQANNSSLRLVPPLALWYNEYRVKQNYNRKGESGEPPALHAAFASSARDIFQRTERAHMQRVTLLPLLFFISFSLSARHPSFLLLTHPAKWNLSCHFAPSLSSTCCHHHFLLLSDSLQWLSLNQRKKVDFFKGMTFFSLPPFHFLMKGGTVKDRLLQQLASNAPSFLRTGHLSLAQLDLEIMTIHESSQ